MGCQISGPHHPNQRNAKTSIVTLRIGGKWLIELEKENTGEKGREVGRKSICAEGDYKGNDEGRLTEAVWGVYYNRSCIITRLGSRMGRRMFESLTVAGLECLEEQCLVLRETKFLSRLPMFNSIYYPSSSLLLHNVSCSIGIVSLRLRWSS